MIPESSAAQAEPVDEAWGEQVGEAVAGCPVLRPQKLKLSPVARTAEVTFENAYSAHRGRGEVRIAITRVRHRQGLTHQAQKSAEIALVLRLR